MVFQDSLNEHVVWNTQSGRFIYALVANLSLATRIAKAAAQYQLAVHNCDKADLLLQRVRQKLPIVLILDWDDCEAEAFKVLKEIAANADLKRIPVVGCLSSAKSELKSVAQRAGCDRVYLKSDFFRSLNDILIRYTQ